MSNDISKRIAQLKQKQEQLARRLNALEQKEKSQTRKLNTRRKIIVGGAVVAEMQKDFNSPLSFVLSCSSAMSPARMIAPPSPSCSRRPDKNMVLAALASFYRRGFHTPAPPWDV